MRLTNLTYGIPNGYIAGLDRNDTHLVAHLYKGTMADPGSPMCARGWNRENGWSYSIFRNNVGPAGVCQVCLRRVFENRKPIGPRDRKTKWI